jgi:hypothetical protein
MTNVMVILWFDTTKVQNQKSSAFTTRRLTFTEIEILGDIGISEVQLHKLELDNNLW